MNFIKIIGKPVNLQKRSRLRLYSELYIKDYRYIGYELITDNTR